MISQISPKVWARQVTYTSRVYKHVDATVVLDNLGHQLIDTCLITHINQVCSCLKADRIAVALDVST